MGGSAGAFLALGLSPLASAPAANADVLDAVLDPIINSLASFDPTMAADLGSLVTSFDPTFLGDQLATAGSAAMARIGRSAGRGVTGSS